MDRAVFSSAKILIPKVESLDKWAVIACDQFTSQFEYWENVYKYVGDAPSTLNVIFPEAELGKCDDERKIRKIHQCMNEYLEKNIFEEYEDSYVYVERTLVNGKIRKGIVGIVDLEKYDYFKGSNSPIRATEETVIERIPPRMKIRDNAPLEFPHILLFCDDQKDELMLPFTCDKDKRKKIYDFELMQNGGHIDGWLISGEEATKFDERFRQYQMNMETEGDIVLAVGDGNHSLATAKACYEKMKKESPVQDWTNHPARYALVELENIQDDSQEFEPIHRVIKDVNVEKLLNEMKHRICADKGISITCCSNGVEEMLYLDENLGSLGVGILQAFLDEYLDVNDGTIDYIHGEEALRQLTQDENAVGFIVPTIDKQQLFANIDKDGVLPRKTFSMGHACEKRYYLEGRAL